MNLILDFSDSSFGMIFDWDSRLKKNNDLIQHVLTTPCNMYRRSQIVKS